jgi:hypothetical protein
MLSGVRPGKCYNLIEFKEGVLVSDVMLGEIENTKIKNTFQLGKLLEIRQYGRSYDPDVVLYFQKTNGNTFHFDPSFGSVEAFVEYQEDTEEDSKNRIQERTHALKVDIEGNDWAMRPENVVATQGIDLTCWIEGNC